MVAHTLPPTLGVPGPDGSLGLAWSPEFIPVDPHAKQLAFLLLNHEEVFFGGSAGGGKSASLLMGALQYVDEPGYHALLLRRTYAMLAMAEALMDRAHEWLGPTAAKWREGQKRWRFPSGATLEFGYLDGPRDHEQYQSAAFQYIGFDELTQFTEFQYGYLFSRLRRLEGSAVPIRMRSASNPGGPGHDWVKRKFIDHQGQAEGRIFVRSTLADNPSLDRVSYERSLSHLDPLTRAQLLDGSWSARREGALFQREWFQVVDSAPADGMRWVRYWDLASTEPKDSNDPDYTVGLKLGRHKSGQYYVADVRRGQLNPSRVDDLVRQTAHMDTRRVLVRMEQEPGASGVRTIDHFRSQVLDGYAFKGDRPTGSKVERARPTSSIAEPGNIRLVNGPWIEAFLDEVEGFPYSRYDDQVDALSGAHAALAGIGSGIPLHT